MHWLSQRTVGFAKQRFVAVVRLRNNFFVLDTCMLARPRISQHRSSRLPHEQINILLVVVEWWDNQMLTCNSAEALSKASLRCVVHGSYTRF